MKRACAETEADLNCLRHLNINFPSLHQISASQSNHKTRKFSFPYIQTATMSHVSSSCSSSFPRLLQGPLYIDGNPSPPLHCCFITIIAAESSTGPEERRGLSDICLVHWDRLRVAFWTSTIVENLSLYSSLP